MKYLLILTLIVPLTQIDGFGQDKSDKGYRPFSILIICPDSISLHESLRPLIDTVEADFRELYYSHLKQMELFEQFETDERRKETKMKIQKAKLAEMEIHSTRYFQFIPMLTCSELWYHFNGEENRDFSFDFIPRDELFSYNLDKVASYYQTDYILTYKSITTPIENGEPVLKIEMALFGKKDSKIIYERTTYGHARFYKDSTGVLRACSNDLQCMLESGAVSSSLDLFGFLKRKQKK